VHFHGITERRETKSVTSITVGVLYKYSTRR
jgi:hypothetical protein